jgi:small neutral amino acid transporter SnatA (MarC family)
LNLFCLRQKRIPLQSLARSVVKNLTAKSKKPNKQEQSAIALCSLLLFALYFFHFFDFFGFAVKTASGFQLCGKNLQANSVPGG